MISLRPTRSKPVEPTIACVRLYPSREVRWGMHATAWSNGRPLSTGAGYGIRLSASDRDRFFDRGWQVVSIYVRDGEPHCGTSLQVVLAVVSGTPQCRHRAVALAQRTCAVATRKSSGTSALPS
jgi:hypothetical protein